MDMYDSAQILCAASAYSEKYYFNEEQFNLIPKDIKKELEIICILFTQDAGGELILYFDDEGSLMLKTIADEADAYYDEITAGLLARKITDNKTELFKQLESFYNLLSEGKLSS